jgi:hypothetical protein
MHNTKEEFKKVIRDEKFKLLDPMSCGLWDWEKRTTRDLFLQESTTCSC